MDLRLEGEPRDLRPGPAASRPALRGATGNRWERTAARPVPEAVHLLFHAIERKLATLEGFNEAMSSGCPWPWAVQLLDAMHAQRLSPNSISRELRWRRLRCVRGLTMVAASCSRGGAWRQVLRLHGDEIVMACVPWGSVSRWQDLR